MRLETFALEVTYGARAALRPTSVALETGGLVALVGPNGAGKSSLLKALAGLAPHGGRIVWNGAPLERLGARERAVTLAYLPQTATFHWPLAVRDLVALGRLPHRGFGDTASAADDEAVEWALQQTETAGFAGRSVARLSAGERARVLLARALAVRAPVLLVDEPIAMLDPYHQLQIMTVLRDYAAHGAAGGPALVLAVLHDLSLAARFCERVLLMSGGRVAADSRPEDVLSSASVRRHYRVEPLITTHEGEPVILPWRRLGD